MNQVIDENSVKVEQRLPFDVVAVPQNNTSGILDTVANAPVNIKIRVRNKEATIGRHEVISVPKLSTSGPKKVRLVSSDQTLISFDLFMEKESVNKVPKKPHYKFLQIFKHSGCFNNKNDDDVYSYVPSSSSETYRAKSASVDDLHGNIIFEKKKSLKKNTPAIMNTNTLRTSTFLGKCKPGGCLDPPFSEDKYIYKPKAKMLAFDQKNKENHRVTDDYNNDMTNSDIVVANPDSVLPQMLSKCSIEKVYSHSLITYPPALSSSQIRVQEETQNRKSKIRTSIQNKVRISINEFSDTYFMPPKKRKSKINGNIDTEFQRTQILRSDSYDAKNSLSNQKEPTQLSAMPTKILYTNMNDKSHKTSVLDNDATFSKLSNTNIENLNLNVKCSVFDKNGSDAASSLNYKTAITTDCMPAQGSQTTIDKIMHTIEDKPISSQENLNKENQGSSILFFNTDENKMNKAPQDYQAFKNKSISNGTLNKVKLMHEIPDNPPDNQSLASQRQYELQLLLQNQGLVTDFAGTDENIIKSEHTPSTDENKNKPALTSDYEIPKNKSIDNETLNQAKRMHGISGEELDYQSLQSYRQYKLQLALKNQDLECDFANTDENIIKFEHDLTNDKIKNKRSSQEYKALKNKSISHETLNQLKLMHGISDELLDNQSMASQRQYKLQLVEEKQDLGSHFTNTDEKLITLEGDLTTHENKNKPVTQDNQASKEENNRSIEIQNKLNLMHRIPDVAIDNQSLTSPERNKLQSLEENQNLRLNFVNTDDNIKKFERDLTSDKISLIDYIPRTESLQQVFFTESANLILHNSDPTQLKESEHSQLSVKENTTNREIIKQDLHQTKPLQDKVSTVSTIDKEQCTNSSFVIEESDTIENKYNDRIISISTVNNADEKSVRLLSDDLISAKLSDNRTNIVGTELKMNNNTISGNTDSSKETSTPTLEEKLSSRLQIQETDTINHKLYYSHNVLDSDRTASPTDDFDVHNLVNDIAPNKMQSLKNMDDNVRDDLSSKYNKSIDKETIETKPKLQLNNHNYLIKTRKENLPRNKHSLIKIDLGFYSFKSDKNETMIKSCDTFKTMEMDPQKKITIIKSMIRKNGSEIRIPVNSEMDLTLQIKKTIDKGSISKRFIDGTTKESAEKTLYKDITLQETLESVYANLVPVKNIIRNLKQKTDSLTQQQLLFRDILKTLKPKSERLISKKCTCNKYLL